MKQPQKWLRNFPELRGFYACFRIFGVLFWNNLRRKKILCFCNVRGCLDGEQGLPTGLGQRGLQE